MVARRPRSRVPEDQRTERRPRPRREGTIRAIPERRAAQAGRTTESMSVITYTDTRGLIARPRTFTEVILEGIAPGGGLFVPRELPAISAAELQLMAALPYAERAALVYEAFGLDVS